MRPIRPELNVLCPIGDFSAHSDQPLTEAERDAGRTVLERRAGREPLAYIQGHGNLVAGLEKALEGKQHGDKVAVSVAPADGYGEHDSTLIQRIPKRSLQGSGEIKKGMQFQGQTAGGMRVFTVTAVVGDMVTLDGNHPLADRTLNFAVALVAGTITDLAGGAAAAP